MQDHYKMLGIENTASQEEIKKAYKKMAAKFHPDKIGGDEAKFKKINEAYQTLGDERKKRIYDSTNPSNNSPRTGPGYHNYSPPGSPFSDPETASNWAQYMQDMFNQDEFFNSVQTEVSKGDDVEMEVNIDLETAVVGGNIEIDFEVETVDQSQARKCYTCVGTGAEPGSPMRVCMTCGGRGVKIKFGRGVRTPERCEVCGGKGQVPLRKCRKCDGTGVEKIKKKVTVRIPPGMDNDSKLRLAGQGNPGRPPGDLYITIKVKPHPNFVRNGLDLNTEVRIPFEIALDGGKIDIPTISGSSLKVTIPENVVSGKSTMRLAGQGIQSPANTRRGDMNVLLHVDLPDIKTPRGRRLFDELVQEVNLHRAQ